MKEILKNINKYWIQFFDDQLNDKYFILLLNNLKKIQATKQYVSPNIENIFKLFKLNISFVQIILVGESPYPNNKIANGIPFGTDSEITPPSLKNIFKEIQKNFPNTKFTSNNLLSWIKQGIITLNVSWSFIKNKEMNKEINKLWKTFTIKLIDFIIQKNKKICIVFFGKKSATIKYQIKPKKDLLIYETVHPSPLSCYKGFIGSQIFSKICNDLNKKIDWSC